MTRLENIVKGMKWGSYRSIHMLNFLISVMKREWKYEFRLDITDHSGRPQDLRPRFED